MVRFINYDFSSRFHHDLIDKKVFRVKFFDYQLPGDVSTVFGLPFPIQSSVEALRRHLYVSLCDLQVIWLKNCSKILIPKISILHLFLTFSTITDRVVLLITKVIWVRYFQTRFYAIGVEAIPFSIVLVHISLASPVILSNSFLSVSVQVLIGPSLFTIRSK